MIRSNVRSEEQCMYAANKANRVLGMVKRKIKDKDFLTMVRFYQVLVRPHQRVL